METVSAPGALLAGLFGGFFFLGGIAFMGIVVSHRRRRDSHRAKE